MTEMLTKLFNKLESLNIYHCQVKGTFTTFDLMRHFFLSFSVVCLFCSDMDLVNN